MKNFGFGCMRLPMTDPEDRTSVDMDHYCRMVDLFLERGYTYFDTAYMYHNGHSEITVREGLVKRHRRDEFLLADKMPTMSLKAPEDQPRIFDEQLEKCGVEYFDYYLLHNLGTDNYRTAQNLGTFDFVARKKEEGRVRHMGFSFHDTPELLDQILTDHPEAEFVQLQLNYLDWDSAGVQSRRCHEVALRHGKPVIVMEPVKGGTLATVPPQVEALFKEHHPQWSPANWAIAFAASQKDVMMVLSGMSSLEQLEENTRFMASFQPLNDQERNLIDRAVEILNESIAIPCTACEYCLEGCPQHIAIPQYFALYNTVQARPTLKYNQTMYYRNISRSHGLASDCIACRHCEQVCPQHLEIVSLLEQVGALFEAEEA